MHRGCGLSAQDTILLYMQQNFFEEFANKNEKPHVMQVTLDQFLFEEAISVG